MLYFFSIRLLIFRISIIAIIIAIIITTGMITKIDGKIKMFAYILKTIHLIEVLGPQILNVQK